MLYLRDCGCALSVWRAQFATRERRGRNASYKSAPSQCLNFGISNFRLEPRSKFLRSAASAASPEDMLSGFDKKIESKPNNHKPHDRSKDRDRIQIPSC